MGTFKKKACLGFNEPVRWHRRMEKGEENTSPFFYAYSRRIDKILHT